MRYDRFNPIPDRSGLPLPHTCEQISEHKATWAVTFRVLSLMTWASRSSMVEKEHEELDIV